MTVNHFEALIKQMRDAGQQLTLDNIILNDPETRQLVWGQRETARLLDEWLIEHRERNRRKAKYAAQGDWIRYVFCAPRFERVEAFAEIQHHLSDRVYWRLLSHVWKRQLAVRRTAVLWSALFKALRAEREAFMKPDCLARYQRLPDRFTAYRGYGPDNEDGFYYSLNREAAASYAGQYGAEGRVGTWTLPKRDCFYVGGRREEIIHIRGLGDVQDIVRIEFGGR